MKKFLKSLLTLLLFVILFIPNKINALENVNIYLFYGDGCPHCRALEEKLDEIKLDYPNINIHYYETWYNKKNSKKLDEIENLLDINIRGVPFTVIGGKTLSGYMEGITDEEIIDSIEYYSISENKCNDVVGNYLGVTEENKKLKNCIEIKENKNFKINIPFIGYVNTKDLSLPIVSILIGALDGFNPCAMWILLFLITMLLNLKDKKRMWLLGLTFLTTSALVYLLFMISWLNIAKYVGSIFYIRLLISLVAIVGGGINLKNYFKTKNDGCHVVKKEKRKKILTKIKKFTSEKSLILSLLGIITLAVSVNFIELVCSAGLPVIFTQVLSMNDLSGMEYSAYIFLYILFFLIDDIIVFVIAMKTLTVTGISTKYGKFSHLIGGIIMILIGILLIFKPEWLMFNF
ncbi:MAG: glutaredoxin family protein [Firmicutes bacterium]|nr:glutaredoxin family protein [Bacillota bacterium]